MVTAKAVGVVGVRNVNDLRAGYTHVMYPDALELTEDDYDALHQALQHDMPRVHRDLLPRVLLMLTREGAIEIALTGTEITVSISGNPRSSVVRVARKGVLQ